MIPFIKYITIIILGGVFLYYVNVFIPEKNILHVIVSFIGLYMIFSQVRKLFEKKREKIKDKHH